MRLGETHALIVVDVQRDFCAGGTLAVPDAEAILPPVQETLRLAQSLGMTIYATRDWHPADHSSFLPQGGVWPVHCVAETEGAAFHPSLELPEDTIVISKGTKREGPGYSGFEAGTGLRENLSRRGLDQLVVVGLATDYCVRATCLDAVRAGNSVFVVSDAVRGVGVSPGDIETAEREMTEAGVVWGRLDDLEGDS